MARNTDTIAALATPAGTAALALIRISGPDTIRVAAGALGRPLDPRVATHGDYLALDGTAVDDIVATLFAGPHSYTGEDSLEISCHGSPLIARMILGDLHARGCRPANPGEFTQRAFLNGRMDLSQAEAVMDLIHARSERALTAARQVLRGALTRHLDELAAGIVGALATVEAYIDFPDEDLPPEDRSQLAARVSAALAAADQLLATERTGGFLREGISTVLLGETNAGKSSLLNRIVGSERAIVSPEPGTTRDFIEELVHAGPHVLRVVDTAGLNAEARGIEALGIGKTLERAASADIHLLVLDASLRTPPLPHSLGNRITPSNTIVVLNKSDLLGDRGLPVAAVPGGLPSVLVSALTGKGVEELKAAMVRMADAMQRTVGEEQIAINVRHAHYLSEARICLAGALEKIEAQGPGELVASDLRGALQALGTISGMVDNERMLDHLFASFCIGK